MKKNKPRLLVVDDTPAVREAIQYYFEQKGYIILSAASAEEALPIIKEINLDVLLSDINLPKMSGIDLVKSIRQFNKSIKVIIMSGEIKKYSNDPHLKQLDILAFMDKPIDFLEIESLIEKAVV
jgi:DNA-binding NtrC family response regulator